MIKPLLIASFFLFTALGSIAQKLPNVQNESVRAPDQVTIDGKFREWGASLQAHNNATNIFYTLANDDSNLYLIVQATDQDVINKIVRGGLTLALQKNGKKDDKNVITVTYPIADISLFFLVRPDLISANDTSTAALAVTTAKYNKLLDQHVKSIGVKGINGIDSLISIYNENKIKAAGLFDLKKVYTIELLLPLEYLQLSEVNPPKFAYHIILNGYNGTPTFGAPRNKDGTPNTSPAAEKVSSYFALRDAQKSAQTDFWGEYTLAKKTGGQ